MKKSFLLYADLYQSTIELTNVEKGELFNAILQYENGIEIQKLTPIVKMAFNFVKQSLDRDNERYEGICKRNQTNGLKGGRPKKRIYVRKNNPLNPNNPLGFEPNSGTTLNNPNNPKKPKKANNDNDNDNDNDTNNNNDIDIKEVKNTYSQIKNITEKDLEDISEKYDVPISFVKSKLDDLINWHEMKPQKNRYANYLRALNDWVKRDSLKIKIDYAKQNNANDISL